ncbi:hypothetical protein D3C80_1140080 [compost metagenome]
MGRKNNNMILLHLPQQLLDLKRHYDIKRCQRLIQQNQRRPCDDEEKHLDFVLHAMGIALDQPVAVFLLKPDDVKIVLDGSPRLNLVPVDVHIELHKFIAGQKLRQNGQGKDIAGLILAQRKAEILSPQKYASAVHPCFSAQAVEQRGFACAVTPQQAVDFTLFKSKVDAS